MQQLINQNKKIPLTLCEVETGYWQVIEIKAKDNPHVMRLRELGLVEGVTLELLRQSRRESPLVARLGAFDFCFEKGLAEHLIVQKEGSAGELP